jgi:hypothetical protein
MRAERSRVIVETWALVVRRDVEFLFIYLTLYRGRGHGHPHKKPILAV